MTTLPPHDKDSNPSSAQKFLPFEEAREYVRALEIKTVEAWYAYSKSGQRPENIPSSPHQIYKNQFHGFGDWLGTNRTARRQWEYLPFEDARAFVQKLGIKTQREWRTYCQSGQKPENIPPAPHGTYKDQFQGYGDWLGTDRIANGQRKFLPFAEARAYIQSLDLKDVYEWQTYCKSGNKPISIPKAPDKIYKGQFQSFGDWLGTGTIVSWKREYLPFEEAREYVHTLMLQSYDEWYGYCKSGQKPESIPATPWNIYKSQFQDMGDWLGGNIARYQREFLSFTEARTFVRMLGIKNKREWHAYCQSGNKPSNIPSTPGRTYKDQYQGLEDWLGTGIARTYRYASAEQRQMAIRRQRCINQRAREIRKKGIAGTHTAEQIQEQLKRQKYKCYYAACGFAKFKRIKENGEWKYDYHVDHTFPLSRVIGSDIPANSIEYLVLACPSCNISKHNKFPWEWADGGRLL